MAWRDDLKSFGTFLLSSLNPRFPSSSNQKVSKVAYLDGLRGFAAFIVYCTHYTGFAHDHDFRFRRAFGGKDQYYFACLPVVRLFFHGGSFAVALFFVISGYVLSVSLFLKLHLQGEQGIAALAKQIGSSFPRRWVRLYMPVIATTFIFMSSWHLFHIQSASAKSAAPKKTFVKEFTRWLDEFIRGSYFFNDGPGFGSNDYDSHMWSIAAEFQGSVIVYVVVLAFSALQYGPNARLYACLALFFYFQFVVDGPYFALFIAGIALCDISSLAEHELRLPKALAYFKFMTKHRWMYYIPLVVGLYLGSCPHVEEAEKLRDRQPGWALLSYTVPGTSTNARWYFSVWSAILCNICIARISWLRRVFESSVCQYLGKVSFGFYLVHGPIMWIAGDRLYAAVGRPRSTAPDLIPGWINILPLSDWGPLGLEINTVVPHLILLPLTLWVAAIVTKLFDEPSVRLSKWMFRQRLSEKALSLDTGPVYVPLIENREEMSEGRDRLP